MKLTEFYAGIEIHRQEKIIYVHLIAPHRVLSTCRSSAGGMHDDLLYVYNHQSCEPGGDHNHSLMHLAIDCPEQYRKAIAQRYSLPFQRCATLGTAANMNNAAICHETYSDLEVVAVCTAGVERNAGRAGDPSSYYEPQARSECAKDEAEITDKKSAAPSAGTINAMIFINRELTPGAMVTAVITATEAKSAALQELEVPSRYSEGLATGTGTDQIAVAAKIGGEAIAYAGKHSKLGELIGRTVHDAVIQALAMQNSLTPAGQCSASVHLQRLGIDEAGLCQSIGNFLSKDNALLLQLNFSNIICDPLTVASVSALVHMRDKFIWGTLPEGCIAEVLCLYGAAISAAVSGKTQRIPFYMKALAELPKYLERHQFLDFVCQAFAMGFSEKWSKRDDQAESD